MSRYVLDCQDFEEQILVLLSEFEILKTNFSSQMNEILQTDSLSLLEIQNFEREKNHFFVSILPSIYLPISVRNRIFLFGLILTSSVLQKGEVF